MYSKPMDSIEITCGDVMKWAAIRNHEPFHAMLCDPPYELNFMGENWDNSGIAFQPDTWAALAEHLLPGAWIMAFASSKGWHRLAIAIEDAGMIIQPSIFGWATGQGYPKGTRVAAYDFWRGYKYGGQILKNVLNPIICAQKPWEGKRLDCIVGTGAGALNVDKGRVGAKMNKSKIQGRLPSNFYIQHSSLCKMQGTQMVKGTGVAIGEKASSIYGSKCHDKGTGRATYANADGFETISRYACAMQCSECDRIWVAEEKEPCIECNGGDGEWICPVRRLGEQSAGDKGGNNTWRFFLNPDWSFEVTNRLEDADFVRYSAKASKAEKHAGLELSCNHPTVKPLSITKWLATLLLPPLEYAPRRLLVPFGGIMSEVIGGWLAGWEHITTIEMDKEYCDFGEKRIYFWLEWSARADKTEPSAILKTYKKSVKRSIN